MGCGCYDLDYSLGWFLAGFYLANAEPKFLRFKGGTCLRKCHFGDYRFSEDLDFTATARVVPEMVQAWIQQAADWSTANDGPDFRAAPSRIETVEDEYGGETYQARLYFRGPLQWGGSPRAIRLDVTRQEALASSVVDRPLIHPYSDGDTVAVSLIPCYSLAEIMAEKLRAVGGQRRFAVSRDLYDIHRLAGSGVRAEDVVLMLEGKFSARDVDLGGLSVQRLQGRRDEFREDWERQLAYLVQTDHGTRFEDAWCTVVKIVAQIASLLGSLNE